MASAGLTVVADVGAGTLRDGDDKRGWGLALGVHQQLGRAEGLHDGVVAAQTVEHRLGRLHLKLATQPQH